MPDPMIIDPEAIKALRELNPGDNDVFLKEIVGIYIEDTAHTIKGSSANVGAVALAAVAERLESLSRRDGLGGVAPLLADCEREYGRAADALRKLSG
jgi:HPt (histidine-containing phosphotransfer) domain-containing protein